MADNVVYINVEDGAKRVMNNTKLYVKLLGKFKDGTNLDEINSTLTAGDMEKAQAAVHTLKGLAANLSMTELFNQSLELENQIKAGAVKPEQFSILKNAFTETLAEAEKVISQYA
jgi:HPt (histidine-containing phosphotransfer) domain-containing protein